jgi:hypothetical protein
VFFTMAAPPRIKGKSYKHVQSEHDKPAAGYLSPADTSRATNIPIWFGIILRVALLLYFPSLKVWLAARNEVSTPITSFKRLKEGVHLFKYGINPYEGGILHQVYF